MSRVTGTEVKRGSRPDVGRVNGVLLRSRSRPNRVGGQQLGAQACCGFHGLLQVRQRLRQIPVRQARPPALEVEPPERQCHGRIRRKRDGPIQQRAGRTGVLLRQTQHPECVIAVHEVRGAGGPEETESAHERTFGGL